MDSTFCTINGDGHLTIEILYAGIGLCVISRGILKVGLDEASVNIITPLRVLGGIIVIANHTIFSANMILCVRIIVIEHDVAVLVIHIVRVHREIELSDPLLTCRNDISLSQRPETGGQVFLADVIHILVHTFDVWIVATLILVGSDRVDLGRDPVRGVDAEQVTALTARQSHQTESCCTESGCYFIVFHNHCFFTFLPFHLYTFI